MSFSGKALNRWRFSHVGFLTTFFAFFAPSLYIPQDVQIVGAPDEKYGEQVAAFIVAKRMSPTCVPRPPCEFAWESSSRVSVQYGGWIAFCTVRL